MPNRRDKRDLFALSASMTGIDIEFIDGVWGKDISASERPDVSTTTLTTFPLLANADQPNRTGRGNSTQTIPSKHPWAAGEDTWTSTASKSRLLDPSLTRPIAPEFSTCEDDRKINTSIF